jgi:hypothetical protein
MLPTHPDVPLPMALPGLVARLAYFVAARAAADAGGAVVGQALVRLRACLAKTPPGHAQASLTEMVRNAVVGAAAAAGADTVEPVALAPVRGAMLRLRRRATATPVAPCFELLGLTNAGGKPANRLRAIELTTSPGADAGPTARGGGIDVAKCAVVDHAIAIVVDAVADLGRRLTRDALLLFAIRATRNRALAGAHPAGQNPSVDRIEDAAVGIAVVVCRVAAANAARVVCGAEVVVGLVDALIDEFVAGVIGAGEPVIAVAWRSPLAAPDPVAGFVGDAELVGRAVRTHGQVRGDAAPDVADSFRAGWSVGAVVRRCAVGAPAIPADLALGTLVGRAAVRSRDAALAALLLVAFALLLASFSGRTLMRVQTAKEGRDDPRGTQAEQPTPRGCGGQGCGEPVEVGVVHGAFRRSRAD